MEVLLLLRCHAALREAYETAPPFGAEGGERTGYLLFARVNTLLTSLPLVVSSLVSAGWEEQSEPLGAARAGQPLRSPLSSLPPCSRAFCRDALFPDVLAFPPGAPLRDLPLLSDGSLLLQDRASCACAHVLAPRPGTQVIDACAAPGKKTAHLAARMNNQGSLAAFDRDPTRAGCMATFLLSAGATCASAEACDFLQVDPKEPRWSAVEAILLDPSCSGSGTTFFKKREESAAFAPSQLRLLLHAMRFPGVATLVYSTCSTSEEENERVVAQALANRSDWRLRRQVLPQWGRRGRAVGGLSEEDATCTLRFCSEEDLCLGFFIACFEPVPKESTDHKSRRRAKKRAREAKT
ncbi:MAG: hypothetical protein SGPRY_008214 [Prymnesium sp.]